MSPKRVSTLATLRVVQDRPVVPQDLLDGLGDGARIVDEALPLIAVPQQREHAAADRVCRRLVPGQRHRVHDVDDVELVDLVGLIARETHEVASEVVDRLGVATGNEVLDVAPHAHDVLRRRDLLLFRQPAVRQQDVGAAPLLEHLRVAVGEAEEAEPCVTREREREPVHEVDDGLVTEAHDEVLGVLAKRRLERLQTAGRHDGQHRLAHRSMARRIGVVERRDALEAGVEHLLCGGTQRHERRRSVGCRPGLAIHEDRLDIVEARVDVVIEVGDGALTLARPDTIVTVHRLVNVTLSSSGRNGARAPRSAVTGDRHWTSSTAQLDDAMHRSVPLDPRAMPDRVNLLVAALHELRRAQAH